MLLLMYMHTPFYKVGADLFDCNWKSSIVVTDDFSRIHHITVINKQNTFLKATMTDMPNNGSNKLVSLLLLNFLAFFFPPL